MTYALDVLPALMAAAVRPRLATATRAGYARFLAAMVCYTRASGERLDHAAEHTADGELKAFFSRLAHEERGHWQLAQADLRGLGVSPAPRAYGGVAVFHARWMASRNPAHWLGALRVLESVGGHLLREAPAALQRLQLGVEATRFVRVHLDVDAEHGDATAALCARMNDPATMTAAALGAASFWVDLHLEALDET